MSHGVEADVTMRPTKGTKHRLSQSPTAASKEPLRCEGNDGRTKDWCSKVADTYSAGWDRLGPATSRSDQPFSRRPDTAQSLSPPPRQDSVPGAWWDPGHERCAFAGQTTDRNETQRGWASDRNAIDYRRVQVHGHGERQFEP